jgi:transposase
LDYLINIKKYSNIVKSKPNCSHDFHLLNEEDIRIDVRRFNSKDSMYLGYTSSMKKSRKNWQDKAKYLKRGGYFGAHINNKEINLYYLPAKFLLKNFYTDRLSIDLTLSWTLTDLLKKK